MPLNQSAPVAVVSADSHAGPRLREDLRDYCPDQNLDDYDAMTAQAGPIVNGQALLGHMAGLNEVRAMGLYGECLAGVAARIAAPSLERLTTPVAEFPRILPLSMAFSGQSGPRPLEKEEMENFRLAPR